MLSVLAVSFVLSSTSCPPGASLAGGQHQRVSIDGAPVHLWCRTGASPRAVVVYVHGYQDTVDTAFTGHRLAEQFAASGVDAFFLAVAAPSGPRQAVVFPKLELLLLTVGERLGGELPHETLLVGHSGGNRTLRAWLTSTRALEVVLLDGLYGGESAWRDWLRANEGATLRLVGQHTWARAEGFRAGLPAALRGRAPHEPAACTHMELVTKGEWLPRVIRESSVGRVALAGA